MAINKNITIVCIAVVMTLAMWMMPETISAQTHKQRLLITTYNTNPIRTATVEKFCASITSRSELINNDQKSTAQSYKNQLSSQLGMNGNTVINTAINGGDIGAQITSYQTALGLFVGFFAVGLVILLFQWSFLCCCCCCPSCCPSKCCQKDENEQYTKCELYWPSIFLILLLLLIIIVCAIGLSKASTFKEGIQDIQCSTAILFDDIVNGNVTLDGTAFFTGVTKLVSTIGDLQSNITDITNNMTSLDTGLTTIVNDLSTAREDLQKVPNNALSGGNAILDYKTKISDPYIPSAGTYTSDFVGLLGSSSTGGIIGEFYTNINDGFNLLSGIKSNASTFASGASGFSSQIGGITADLNSVQTQITDLDNSMKDALDLMETPKDIGNLVINLIYGIALGVAVLALLGVILMTFCDKYKCRYLMYFSCVVLFFFGILGFFVAIIFSIIVPVMYLFCEWLDVTITSSGFTTNTAGLNLDAQVQNILSTCLVGGPGDIMTAVGGASIGTTLSGLTNAINYTNSFNTSSESAAISSAITNITAIIDTYKNGGIIDVLNDSDSVLAIQAITKMQDFGGCPSSPVDSYVPSMTNTSLISCAISASTVNSGTCSSAANFQAGAAGCTGCIDTTSILYAYYSGNAQGTWKTSVLDPKYGAGCAWTTHFGNVWDNYYRVKLPVMNDIRNRWTTAQTSLNTVITDFSSVNTTMENLKSTINSALSPILDPTYGLIAGLNCKIIGQDLQLMVSSVCVSNFNTMYITRLLMGIAAFGILFAMCCIVCSGVRHFKHSQRKDKVSPNFFGDKNSFENTDAAFRP